MAKSPGRRLKVFQAQFGFFDTVVAAPSQAAALRVWGTRQNLFTNGQARLATDDAAIQAAVQHPEILLRRAVGSSNPFVQEPVGLPEVPAAPARRTSTPKPKPPPRPEADRSRLDAAEAALTRLDRQRLSEEAGFRREAEALEARSAAAQDSYVDARKKAKAAVAAAETAYRKAGGQG